MHLVLNLVHEVTDMVFDLTSPGCLLGSRVVRGSIAIDDYHLAVLSECPQTLVRRTQSDSQNGSSRLDVRTSRTSLSCIMKQTHCRTCRKIVTINVLTTAVAMGNTDRDRSRVAQLQLGA